VRQIYPGANGAGNDAGSVDLAAAYAYPATKENADPGQAKPRSPWIRANMVASVDGAATVKGLSGGLSTAEDRTLFHLLRGLADVVLVGAGTVRAEGYGPARPRAGWAGLRAGRTPSPPIAILTRMLDLDLSTPMFTEAPRQARTIVLTTEAAPATRRAEAARHADVVIAGTSRVELPAAIAALAGRGWHKILVEGGPHLLGEFAVADLLDELCLTVSPILVGGNACRIMADAALSSPSRLRLAHVLEAEGSLFCRYVRDLQ
jgi:riboflavin biosynthesis pyrimidine reductase